MQTTILEVPMRYLLTTVLFSAALLSTNAEAEVYAYTNADGDYIVSQKKPANPDTSYAVLTDEGEFIRMVEGRKKQIPITHWRPFFLPKEPHPLDGVAPDFDDAEPDIGIEEVEPED
ncbi:MAG: hypothetical protein RJQ07_01055 [Pseudomonadales bacterium]